jgi:preprotein translocase subunit SecG
MLCKLYWYFGQLVVLVILLLVLLPGVQKGRDIKASLGKGQGAVLAKKGQFASYKEKLEKRTEFHSF